MPLHGQDFLPNTFDAGEAESYNKQPSAPQPTRVLAADLGGLSDDEPEPGASPPSGAVLPPPAAASAPSVLHAGGISILGQVPGGAGGFPQQLIFNANMAGTGFLVLPVNLEDGRVVAAPISPQMNAELSQNSRRMSTGEGKSALAKAQPGQQGQRKTVTMSSMAEELTHGRGESQGRPVGQVVAVPLNDAAEKKGGGIDPNFAAMLQHKLAVESSNSQGPAAGGIDPGQLQAALGRAAATGDWDAEGGADRQFYQDDEDEAPGASRPAPTRSNTLRGGDFPGLPVAAASDKDVLPAGKAYETAAPAPTRAGTMVQGGPGMASATALQAQVRGLEELERSPARASAFGGVDGDGEVLPRAPRPTTKLDEAVLDQLDDDVEDVPYIAQEKRVVGGGGVDVDFAAKLQRSLEAQRLETDDNPANGEDDDSAVAPKGARAPRPTMRLEAAVNNLDDDDEPVLAGHATVGHQAAAASSGSASRPPAEAPAVVGGTDFQSQLLAKLQQQAAPAPSSVHDPLAASLLSGDFETSLKRKLAAEAEDEADEELTEAAGFRAPRPTVVLSKDALNGAWPEDDEEDDGGGAAKEVPPLPRDVAAAQDAEEKSAPPPGDKPGLLAPGGAVGGQQLADSPEICKARVAGLSTEQLAAENNALRAEVDALRAILHQRRKELGLACA